MSKGFQCRPLLPRGSFPYSIRGWYVSSFWLFGGYWKQLNAKLPRWGKYFQPAPACWPTGRGSYYIVLGRLLIHVGWRTSWVPHWFNGKKD